MGDGPLNWLPYGTPQISLHRKPAMPIVPFGETVQTWYAFLKGEGTARTWYCIGMGDGTRWALVPLERYQENILDGAWVSSTERWEFGRGTVRLTRDGHSGIGTYNLKGNILTASNMPAPEYAVFVDKEQGRLTLMSRQGAASILTREGESRGGQQQPAIVFPPGQDLVGNWLGGPETDYARLQIQPVPGTPYFNLHLQRQGREKTVCTFAVSDGQLLATFGDGSRAAIRFLRAGNRLTLHFPAIPEMRFTRQ